MSASFRLIDTHSHVHFATFEKDIDAVLSRARDAGVGMITVGTLQKTSREAVEFAQKHENVWAAVGLHPNNIHFIPPSDDEGAGGHEDFDYNFYRDLAYEKKVVAIGETGMDAYRIPDGFDREKVLEEQEKIFRQHLDLCDDVKKPVIIHVRDAHEQVARVLAEYVTAGKLSRRGVMHCFTGTPEQAQFYLDLGMYISIPGIITFPPKKSEPENSLIAVVRVVPHERLLIETDCPYLTPVPHRGERNEPSYVIHTAEAIAQIWEIAFEDIAAQTTKNACKLFNLS